MRTDLLENIEIEINEKPGKIEMSVTTYLIINKPIGLERECIGESEELIYDLNGKILWNSFSDIILEKLKLAGSLIDLTNKEVNILTGKGAPSQKSYLVYKNSIGKSVKIKDLRDYVEHKNISLYMEGINLEEIFKLI